MSKKSEINKEMQNMDLYKLLEVEENAHAKEIKKAYRKKALILHPDKNPDNPQAATMFHQLSEALKILSDVGARAAYDHLRQAKKAAKARTDNLDKGRKKVKLDLEARERMAMEEQYEEKKQAQTLKEEIYRLREEGSRILQEEQAAMRKIIKEEKRKNMQASQQKPARLKLKWKSPKHDPDNGGYDDNVIMKLFSKFGLVTMVVLSSKKRGTAIVEFNNEDSADLAYLSETGLSNNPLRVSWLGDRPVCFTTKTQPLDDDKELFPNNTPPAPTGGSDENEEDNFELQVMKRMREAQERKRALEKVNELNT